MTAPTKPRSTSTARGRRSRPKLTGHPLIRPVMTLHCDRCGRYRAVAVHDWLCEPCRAGGAQWSPA